MFRKYINPPWYDDPLDDPLFGGGQDFDTYGLGGFGGGYYSDEDEMDDEAFELQWNPLNFTTHGVGYGFKSSDPPETKRGHYR